MKSSSIQDQANLLKVDLRSKLVDGLLAALILYLLTALIVLMVWPFDHFFGRPGLLVYALAILAVSIFCLERSLVRTNTEARRAWYGIVGGILGWMVTDISNALGAVKIASLAGGVSLLMLALIIATLWKRGLPLGAQFYSQAFIMSWTARLGMLGLRYLIGWSPVFQLSIPLVGWGSLLCLLIAVVWLFGRSEWRLQRMWCALWIWFFLTLALIALRGNVV